jgi:hypothetical protein
VKPSLCKTPGLIGRTRMVVSRNVGSAFFLGIWDCNFDKAIPQTCLHRKSTFSGALARDPTYMGLWERFREQYRSPY